jgi:hypothetical protein
MTYATLAEVVEEIKGTNITDADRNYLLRSMNFVTQRIDEITEYSFWPKLEVRSFDTLSTRMDDRFNTITLDAPLLALTSCTIGEIELTLDTELAYYPKGSMPIFKLRRLNGFSWSWDYPLPDVMTNSWIGAIKITGYWGYNTRYPDCYYDTLEDLASNLSSSASTLIVTNTLAADGRGLRPRFSPGMLLRLGAELVRVIDVDDNTKTLTLARGAQGTTAAAHLSGVSIEAWENEVSITRAAVLWTHNLFKRKGERVRQSDGSATASFDPVMPKEVMDLLLQFANMEPDTLE